MFFDKEEPLKSLIEGTDRPYSVVLSVHLSEDMLAREGKKTQKHATKIKEGFENAVKKYRSVFPKEQEKVFFVFLEYNMDTGPLFQKMEIQSFPTTVLISSKKKIDFKEPTFQLTQFDRFTGSDKKEFFDFLEENFSLGIFDSAKEEKISVSIFNILIGYSMIILMGKMLFEFAKKGLLVPIMAFGSIAVFWVSTSGLIKCIIHNLPMVYQDRQGNPQVFINDGKQQTIMEGMVISSAYVGLAICLSTFTFFLPYVKNESVKNFSLYATFIVGALAYIFVLDCWEWKSHMRTMIYGSNL